ncbi:MAG TPA: YaaA family protein [Candidatus Saccharibacteria bacterium]|nr:YaaA family protein [Candidatus Saccharibacteria bacterium]
MALQILLHSSKTMRAPNKRQALLGSPVLLSRAEELVDVWRGVSVAKIQSLMKVSEKKAHEAKNLFDEWSANPIAQVPAIDAFIGDIYSGLQVQTWSDDDRAYAHEHLLILSGLYGGLRACDGVMPYRLEMGYKLPDGRSMYQFWGDSIASSLPTGTDCILNLSAVEYTKALLPHVDIPVITPKFLTISPKTGRPTFVTVHTKIARGAFARWVVQNRIEDVAQLQNFSDLNYRYDPTLSTPDQPVFVCKEFGGLGLSVRLVNIAETDKTGRT